MVAFNQLDPFITAWGDMAAATGPLQPRYTPVAALDPWLGGGLVEYCRAHLVSDIPRTGVDTREMLAAVSGDLSQMAFKSALRAFWNSSSGAPPLSSSWVDAWWAFLVSEWQDLATGTWGARYTTGTSDKTRGLLGGTSEIVQAHDLSITFHILSYAHKDHRRAPKLYPELYSWLLSPEFLVEGVYPLGRLYHGAPCAHNDYDLARLWQLVLPAVPDPAPRKATAEWLVNATSATVAEQLGPDHVFAPRMGSIADAQYFGVAMLKEVGYFNASSRWWAEDYGRAAADALWPEATQTCCAICGALSKMGLSGGLGNSTWQLLDGACPACAHGAREDAAV